MTAKDKLIIALDVDTPAKALDLVKQLHSVAGMFKIGSTLPIVSNQALFSLLGITYGGNGTTNFRLPDLRPIEPDGMTYGICVEGVFPY